jgi:hypothetical protein
MFIFAALGLELRTSHLGRRSITWATPPAPVLFTILPSTSHFQEMSLPMASSLRPDPDPEIKALN